MAYQSYFSHFSSFWWILVALSFLIFAVILNKKSEENETFDIIIVGAGFSGVAAANSLHEHGVRNFLVLEAKENVGGRARKANFAGLTVALGAGWVHSGHDSKELQELVRKTDLKIQVEDYDDLTYRDGENGRIENDLWEETIKEFLQKFSSARSEEQNKQTLEEFLKLQGWLSNSNSKATVEYMAVDFENANPSKLLSATHDFVTGDDDFMVTDERGYERIAELITEPFRQKVKTGREVKVIEQYRNRYQVSCADGSMYRAKYLLVAVYKSVLENRYIEFKPDLPAWKYDAMQYIVNGHYCKIFTRFPYKFWDDTNFIMLGRRDKQFVHWQNYNRMHPNQFILMATLTGEECRQSQLETDHMVKEKIYHVLSRVYGRSIPRPTEILRSNWSFDPHVQGAYSNAGVGARDEHYDLVRKPINFNRLWFTGAHTSMDTSGYVQGALKQGRFVGTELAKHVMKMEKTHSRL